MTTHSPIVGIAELFLLICIIFAVPALLVLAQLHTGRALADSEAETVALDEEQINAAIEEAFANGMQYAQLDAAARQYPIHDLDTERTT